MRINYQNKRALSLRTILKLLSLSPKKKEQKKQDILFNKCNTWAPTPSQSVHQINKKMIPSLFSLPKKKFSSKIAKSIKFINAIYSTWTALSPNIVYAFSARRKQISHYLRFYRFKNYLKQMQTHSFQHILFSTIPI